MFYLIDKPLGISSFDVIRKLRKILNIKKMGHAGTLDPLATGCLLIATENSTKLLPLLEGSDKTYVFTVDISGVTPSLDLGTDITYHPYPIDTTITSEELRDFLLNQTEQIPPKYSALHVDGKRAYDLARGGDTFELEPRSILVRDVSIIDISLPQITIALRISSGGYIRSFAPIIGRFFGAQGGHIVSLRRTHIHTHQGRLSLDQAHPLDTINYEDSIARNLLFPDIESIEIGGDTQLHLQQGRILDSISSKKGIIGTRYFLNYENSWSSLVEYREDGFHIIRNDI